ncbi:MAG: CBS domain-containing protein [Solirubrobacteraceae bacterium]
MIGVLVMAAGAEQAQEQVVSMFTGVSAGTVMSQPAVNMGWDLALAEAAEYFARFRFTAFPVTDRAGRTKGMLRIDQLEQVPAQRRGTTAVADVMNHDPALPIGKRTDVGHVLELPALAQFGRAVVVDHTGRPLGVLSLTDIQRAIRASRLDQTGGQRRLASH